MIPSRLQKRAVPASSSAPRRASRREGFTLLELIIVLVILSVATTVVWSRLPRLSSTERSEGLRRLALANEALHEEAAFKKKALL